MPRIVPGLPQVMHLAAAAQGRSSAKCNSCRKWAGWWDASSWRFLAMRIVSRRRLLRVFQGPGFVHRPARIPVPGLARSGNLEVGHPSCRPAHRGAVQLLGKLSAAGLSYAPARHRRELRGQYRRPHDRHLGGAATTQLANVMPGAGATTKLAYSAAAVAFLVYAVGFIASFWLPEPRQDRLLDD